MYYVYVIQSEKTKDLYFGFTADFVQRLEHHNTGNSRATRFGMPWRYVYIEGYRVKRDAMLREKKLKQYGNARTYIKQRIQHSLS